MRENLKTKNHVMKTQFIPDVTPIQPTKGSACSDSSTRKSGKRTQQTNRPKTYYKVEKVF